MISDFTKKKKKYCHIEDDIDNVIEELEKGNFIGDRIKNLQLPEGENSYKVRAVNTDTNNGKSNGYRVIYYVIMNEKTVFLLTIYYKKDDTRIPNNKEISDLIQKYCD